MIIPELATSLVEKHTIRKKEAWCICLLILRLRSELTPENFCHVFSTVCYWAAET